MSDKASKTAAVLDEMVAGIMGVKADKATKLTPVGTESATPISQQFGPLESPYGGLMQAVARIREGLSMMDKYIGAIERDAKLVGENKASTPMRDELDEAWGETKEEFSERFDRISKEAQAATFSDEPTAGWACPTHGVENVIETTSPKGRKFHRCEVGACKEFERR